MLWINFTKFAYKTLRKRRVECSFGHFKFSVTFSECIKYLSTSFSWKEGTSLHQNKKYVFQTDLLRLEVLILSIEAETVYHFFFLFPLFLSFFLFFSFLSLFTFSLSLSLCSRSLSLPFSFFSSLSLFLSFSF